MPKETDRLKLPLPLGNENVTRESINGIFEKIDAGVATEKEVRDAHELASSKQNVIKLANNFAAPDTAITAYPEGYSVFYVGGGTGGQGGVWRTTVGATEAFGYVETVRVGTGGYQTFTEMYSGSDTANRANNKQYKRNKRDSNASWQPFERELDVDDYNSLVTYSDNGFIKKSVIIPTSANLNNYIEEGRFYCPANVTVQTLLNCPVSDVLLRYWKACRCSTNVNNIRTR
ncbi:pyocin knob domain-containing protein [Paenibacillus amylolyticus]|nr:pyocin knob domain-containing protein [Paenibacillus amylolyticus]